MSAIHVFRPTVHDNIIVDLSDQPLSVESRAQHEVVCALRDAGQRQVSSSGQGRSSPAASWHGTPPLTQKSKLFNLFATVDDGLVGN